MLLATLGLTAPTALAHGGRLKPPPEDEPPPEEERDLPVKPPPFDAPPPDIDAPPPPVAPPTEEGDKDNSGGKDARPRRPRARITPWEERWQTWWRLNRWRWMPERHASRTQPGAVVTPSTNEGPNIDPHAAWEHARALVASRRLAPMLREILADKAENHGELRSAALIALAKVDTSLTTLEALLGEVARKDASNLNRESAALAIGLLRRTDPKLQIDARLLDAARDKLLEVLDERSGPTRTRAFAAFAIGLLADQPYATSFTREGRVMARELWTRLVPKRANDEIAVAVLTALGQHPRAGVSDEVRGKLRGIVLGKRVLGRGWTDRERAHALTALVRLQGEGSFSALIRALGATRAPRELRRAALVAAAEIAARVDLPQRDTLLTAVMRAAALAKSPLTKGLRRLAIGRIVGADLRAGNPRFLRRGPVVTELLGGLKAGAVTERSFAALGLGLAAHALPTGSKAISSFGTRVRTTLTDSFSRARGGDEQQGAVIIALGLTGTLNHAPALAAIVRDSNNSPEVRAHAATALGMLGSHKHGIPDCLRRALRDRRSDLLPSEAGMALALLGKRESGKELANELLGARTERAMAFGALALGHLGDLTAAGPVMASVRDTKRSSIARAMAVAALGLLADPERRPSLVRLSIDSCYPALSNSMHELFTIL